MCKQTREEKLTQLDSFNQQPVILLPGGGSASQLMRMHSFQLQWINSNKSVGLHVKCMYAVCTYHYFKNEMYKTIHNIQIHKTGFVSPIAMNAKLVSYVGRR